MARAGAMNDRVLPPAYSLVQCIERLPAHARRRYDDMRALLSDSEALQRSLMERIKVKEERLAELMRRRSYASVPGGDAAEVERLDGELAAVRVDLDRLDKERSRRNGLRANCEQVLRQIDVFLMTRASGAGDFAAPPRLTKVPAGRRKGESIADALLRTRREIASAQGELMRIKAAPLPADEIKLAIIERIDALAKAGAPAVVTEGGKVTVHWPDVMQYGVPGEALTAPSGSASKLMAWLFREPLLKKLIAGIEDNEDGVSSGERPQRVREVEERIFGLEIAEEKLVCQALDAGLEVHRRIDASPWALLDLGVVEKAVAEAAE
jgi:hypothetical protein